MSFSPSRPPTVRMTPSRARWLRLIIGWAFRLWRTRSGAASARCAGTNGCFGWAIRWTNPCASARNCSDGSYPILRERTPVRMDLTHSGWSDIFFLGMDYPEGARVINVSVDLGVLG